MSLFRIAAVLAVGIAIMPSERDQQERLYQQAAHAAHWTATFCDRNVTMCDQAGTAWSTFLKKAQFAMATAWDVAQRNAQSREREPQPVSAPAPLLFERSRGTLTRGDLEPAWRGRDGGA